ncbi:MAG TPA: hypothetical protein VHZ24_01665 [Pirellulales bacterium]|nr:hypothetical protein [Pirellulales bacterium]
MARRASWSICIAVLGAYLLGAANRGLGDPLAVPSMAGKIVAPDLVAAAKQYINDLDQETADEKAFADNVDKIKRDSNTLIIVALVLSKHDGEHELANAAAMIPPAQALAKAKDLTDAKKSVALLRDVLAGNPPGANAPNWEKVASLGRVMEQVAGLNTKLRNSIRRLDPRKTDENARAATVMAAVGQAIVFDTHEVKDEKLLPQWYTMSDEMRDACSELAAAIRSGDKTAAASASTRVQKSCDACHEVFGD